MTIGKCNSNQHPEIYRQVFISKYQNLKQVQQKKKMQLDNFNQLKLEQNSNFLNRKKDEKGLKLGKGRSC